MQNSWKWKPETQRAPCEGMMPTHPDARCRDGSVQMCMDPGPWRNRIRALFLLCVHACHYFEVITCIQRGVPMMHSSVCGLNCGVCT